MLSGIREVARLRAGSTSWICLCTMVVVSLTLTVAAATAQGEDADDDSDGACSETTELGLLACRHEARDDFFAAAAICENESDSDAGDLCEAVANRDRREALGECDEIAEARDDFCEALGQDPYDPPFDPADFDADPGNPSRPNPYWPLTVGNVWEFVGGDETVTVEVLDETKLIGGVTCITINDVVRENGRLIEDTDDWYASEITGDVWYCGEIAMDFETFSGDRPRVPELVEIDGSWKHGRDGARAGYIMLAIPKRGDVYRQEWAFGDAEDGGEVLETRYSYGKNAELDELVPEELARLLCRNDCLVTRDFTPLEPDTEERKYYAPGIGPFLEVNVEEGDIVQLVGCNFDPICDQLPEPEGDDELQFVPTNLVTVGEAPGVRDSGGLGGGGRRDCDGGSCREGRFIEK